MTWPKKVADAIRERSEGLCEGCGERPATEMHHRQFKSRGGKDILVNALHLCGWGNHTGCHGVAHSAEGGELGWSVNSWENPALKPVLYRGVLRWLTDYGPPTDVEPEPTF